MTGESGGLRDETIHHYLETIFYIAHEGEVVRPGRIAEWQGVSAPTVSTTLQRLEKGGWITIAPDRSVKGRFCSCSLASCSFASVMRFDTTILCSRPSRREIHCLLHRRADPETRQARHIEQQAAAQRPAAHCHVYNPLAAERRAEFFRR